ncbi:hypothetical protein T4D_16816 [Trichinella pseudospiralis]|uniref:Uncharacterized protein n=1 Tax=Trichinella pseudospiralis TaxID=6337 RepID=A0A0V1FCW4_TRIPS|nr:hypothetical protein T4D_16816 [Trichinella pseudospiralis]
MKINELQWDSHTTKKSLGKGLPLPTEKMERRRRRVLAAYCNDESLPLLFRLFPYAYSAAANNDNDVAAANAAAAAAAAIAVAVAVAVSASAAAVLNLTLELLRSESIAASQAERGREVKLILLC